MMDDDAVPQDVPHDGLESIDLDNEGVKTPQQLDHNSEMVEVDPKSCRDAVTGRFTKGWKGGGRPHGSKDRFTKRVVDTLEACWDANAEAMLQQLAAEDPKVIMGMIAKLMPSNLIEEDITGIAADSSRSIPEVTIRLINKVEDEGDTPALPREVEGELLPPSTTH